jgi:DNA-binding NtrC family response regulator
MSPEEHSTTRVLEGEPSFAVRAADIVVQEGPDRGARVKLGPGATRIGTAQGNQLKLHDPTVSRLHCEVQLRRDGVRIVDSGSTNGVIVDGTRVRDADITAGAAIRIGATTLRLELGDEPIQVPLSPRDRLGEILGASVEMRRLYAIVERVAPTDVTVLIQGETGSGKELVAREIHNGSRRADRPFVAVDAGAIAPTVIESELFGHVRGAFSGAVGDRRGLFEEAHGGTLFLDEIGELPIALQAKLLRVLETHEVRRVGANASRKIDVRVLAATNRTLARAVNEGEFREELYHRLAVVEIRVPPLRSRREDLPMLAQRFLERFGMLGPVPPDLLSNLVSRGWPGNVRELRNTIERYVALSASPGAAGFPPPPSTLPAGVEALIPVHLPLKDARLAWMEEFETVYTRTLLRNTGGNVTRAAELAGVSRRFLQRLMVRVGIRPEGASREADDVGDDDE